MQLLFVCILAEIIFIKNTAVNIQFSCRLFQFARKKVLYKKAYVVNLDFFFQIITFCLENVYL